ncbi:MAG: flagellin [Syntrophobacterales bacterium]|nr:flagellin [Syntrophobacterales bacterium]
MKVSFALTYENPLRHIFSKQKEISRLQEAISQGKGLLEPSDNPLSWSNAMNLKTAMAKAEQWKENINFGANWNNITEGHLNHLNDLLTRAREIAIGAIKINSPETVLARAKELDQILREVITIANAKYQNRYVFSVNSDTGSPLFGYTEVNGQVASIINPADPLDMAEPLYISVGETTPVQINVDGQRLFFDEEGNSILQNLLNLRNAISSGNTNQIGDAMEHIERDQSRVLEALTTVGTTLNRLEARNDALEAITITQQDRLGDLEETDMAKLITEYQLTTTALQAVYQSTARITGLSLLQYL